MDFADKIAQFAKRAESLKNSIITEEATKTSLVMPFFSLLGYDVFNPEEFLPEFTADVGIKKGEKVDYAIIQDGEPVIIIEAKAITRNLEKHDSQLFRYFATTKARFAILTNGIRYRFFTDLEAQNKMDDLPFLDFNILNMRENQIIELQKFEKSNFNIAKIFDSASVLKYEGKFKDTLYEQFSCPSDEFIRFFLQGVYSGVKTQSVVDRFRPILKASMQEFISETMNDKIKSALSSAPQVSSAPSESGESCLDGESQAQLVPTEEEMDAYYFLQNQFKDYIKIEDITYKKNESYLSIQYKGNSRKWLCRLIFSPTQKILFLPGAEKREIRCNIANIYELGNYSRYMLSVLSRYTELNHPVDPVNPPIYQLVIKRRIPKHKGKQSLKVDNNR